MRKVGILAVVFVLGFTGGVFAAQGQGDGGPAERVTGIGGIFFKARDPRALSAWYRDNLGVAVMEGMPFATFDWRERDHRRRKGTTVWALFKDSSDYFAPSQASFMINYRVADLDQMLAQLKAAGVAQEGDVQEESNGRFAWVVDPEGNKIELWQPAEGE